MKRTYLSSILVLLAGSFSQSICSLEMSAHDETDNPRNPRLVLQRKRAINAVSFDRSGTKILVGSSDRTGTLLNAQTGELLYTSTFDGPVFFAALNPEGTQALLNCPMWKKAGSTDAVHKLVNVPLLWDSEDESTHTLEHERSVLATLYNPRGTQLITCSEDKVARLWNSVTKQVVHTLLHTGVVYTAAFNHNGSLVLIGARDNSATLWDTEEGSVRQQFSHNSPLMSVALSHNGRRALTGSEDGEVKLWSVRRGTLLGRQKNTHGVRCVLFNPLGTQLLTLTADGNFTVCDSITGKKLFQNHHDSFIILVAYNSLGTMILSAANSTIYVWDATDGKEVHSCTLKSQILSASFNNEGTQIVIGTARGDVLLWDLR